MKTKITYLVAGMLLALLIIACAGPVVAQNQISGLNIQVVASDNGLASGVSRVEYWTFHDPTYGRTVTVTCLISKGYLEHAISCNWNEIR